MKDLKQLKKLSESNSFEKILCNNILIQEVFVNKNCAAKKVQIIVSDMKAYFTPNTHIKLNEVKSIYNLIIFD